VSLALVRSFAEHRAEQEVGKRTAIVENARILGPLFLFNNLHAAHHLRGRLPWYQVPKFYRLNRAALIESNGGLVYNSYFDVARRYLFSSHDRTIHPGWGNPAA
jgi:fatty acid desaturase